MNRTLAVFPSQTIVSQLFVTVRQSTLSQEAIISLNIAVYCFSTLANALAALVFFKDGFKTIPNISFFALALCDLLVSVVWIFYLMPFQYSILLAMSHTAVFLQWYSKVYLFPCVEAINTMGSWITTIITWERLCCILIPLKVKLIFSRKSLAALYLGSVLYEVVALTTYFVGMNLRAETGRQLTNYWLRNKGNISSDLDLFIAPESEVVGKNLQIVGDMARSYVPNYILYSAIVLGTILLVIEFRRSVRVKKVMTGNQGTQKMSKKEAKLIKSVVSVCIIYIATCTPLNVYDTVSRFDRLFAMSFYLWGDISKSIRSLNHASNIFIYLTVNSKFRTQFKSLFCGFCKKLELPHLMIVKSR